MTEFFMLVGIVTIVFLLGFTVWILWDAFQIWREHHCKIKFICKHTYEYDWVNSSFLHDELGMKCKICGKQIKFRIEPKSFKDFPHLAKENENESICS